ncbi:hypothetical protein DMUE_2845 [Dictyocoela muelleri]|nr:hypothetical protein DMUE_2845 [Dictyocoela muelleri]
MNEIGDVEKFNIQKYDILRYYYNKLRKEATEISNSRNNELLDIYKYTFDNNLFLQYESGSREEERNIIFTTEYNLRILNQSETWLCDGTFFVAPNNFEQVYNIHCKYFGKLIPMIYVLMKRRNESSYDFIFNFLKSKVSENQ